MTSPAPAIYVTRDLLRHRKLPGSQTGLSALVSNYLSLLGQTDSLPASLVRQAFVPALLGIDARPNSQEQMQDWDEQIRACFSPRLHQLVCARVRSVAD